MRRCSPSRISRALRLIKSGLFGGGPVTILPNTFYAVRAAAARRDAATQPVDPVVHRLDREQGPRYGRGRIPAEGAGAAIIAFPSSACIRPDDMAKLEPVARFVASGQLQRVRPAVRPASRARTIARMRWCGSIRCARASDAAWSRVVSPALACSRPIFAEFAELRDGDVYLYKNADRFLHRP